METENNGYDGYDGYQYESNSQDGDSQYGDGITINKSIARSLTAKIIKTSPLQKEGSSNIIQKENVDKITTTDILTHFQTIINVSDLIICLQRINQEQYLSGVRIVRIASLEKQIPRKIYIHGQLVTIRNEGQQNLKKCYKCNDYGHIAKDCGNEPKRRWEQKDYCFKYGRYGHQSTECYNDNDNRDQENPNPYHTSDYAEAYCQNTDNSCTTPKFFSFDSGIRYFGQGFPSPPKKDNVENTQEFVKSENFDNNLESDNQYQTGNTTYENNWENEESWEKDTQDSNTNKQEIIQQNELQIGEIIEISCKLKEKTVEADETENTYVFTENKQTSEAETVDIVENVDKEIQTKENEHMENMNTEAKKKKDKSKVGKKKFEDKTGDKDKTKRELHKKGVVTLVKNDIECTNHYFTNHILNGRLVHTSFKADDKVLNLLNIYSPTKSTRQQGMFYREMIEYCASVNVESHRNIMLGDFNYWWENGKKRIKEMTIRFSKKLVARERKELSDTYIHVQLENEENKTQPDQVTINNLSEIIIDLENKEKMGTIIRSRKDYYEEDIDNIDFFKRKRNKEEISEK
ncbi:CNBP [Mytilus coruscus]|uniref:CNBP n=1 Tax=Mytilus coruscus TaxID=42192 RepID=A0A6J8EZ74_MYTCO|nr:CNBP [Mytilus coruscus]